VRNWRETPTKPFCIPTRRAVGAELFGRAHFVAIKRGEHRFPDEAEQFRTDPVTAFGFAGV
jgi:hypothetical protein